MNAIARTMVVSLGVATTVLGQDPFGQEPAGGQDPITSEPVTSPLDPVLVPFQSGIPLQGEPDPDNLDPVWARPEAMQGFPVFPESLGGYPYPAPKDWLKAPAIDGELPLAPELGPDWPSWIKAKSPRDLPYQPDLAVLVRHSDRIWLRPAGDDAFVPLYHWDPSRALAAGSEVRVRQFGQFLLLLHGGSRIDSAGPTQLEIQTLDETSARVDFREFTRLDLFAYERSLVCSLPGGTVIDGDPALDVRTPAEPAAGDKGAPPKAPADGKPAKAAAPGVSSMAPRTAGQKPAPLTMSDALPLGLAGKGGAGIARELHLVVLRADEPGWYGGRATIWNGGARPAMVRTARGEALLKPGYRVTVFLQPSRSDVPADLRESGATAAADGNRRRWQATAPATVSWSGARFTLPAGSTLEIDPMLGDAFGAPAGPAK